MELRQVRISRVADPRFTVVFRPRTSLPCTWLDLYWEGAKLELANGFSVGGGQLNVEKRFWSAGVLVGLAGARARSSRPRKEAGPQLAERPPSHVGV